MSYKAKIVGRVDIPRDRCIVLDHARLIGEDYSGRNLFQFCTIGCRLEKCRFAQTRIEGAQFGSGRDTSVFVECDFEGARLDGVGVYCRFERCSFRNVDLSHWICIAAEFIDCTFTGRLRQGVFNGTIPSQFQADAGREHNEFHGNDFSGMDLIDVAFRGGIDLTQQRLPSGPQYLYTPDAAAAIERTRIEVETWPASEHRETALAILGGLSDEVREGQVQLFLRPAEWVGYGPFTKEGTERLFALLSAMSD